MKKAKTITIDCREMQPPDPLVKVLRAVDSMAEDEEVLMIHRHEPGMLFTQLKDRGVNYEVDKKDDGQVEILIWRD